MSLTAWRHIFKVSNCPLGSSSLTRLFMPSICRCISKLTALSTSWTLGNPFANPKGQISFQITMFGFQPISNYQNSKDFSLALKFYERVMLRWCIFCFKKRENVIPKKVSHRLFIIQELFIFPCRFPPVPRAWFLMLWFFSGTCFCPKVPV